ncbi:endonuclease exonuclease phosphatase family domain containing protein [Musa troglodytarum]|uniref:Endonuclease exonuclease phosphatase family domain containing protein n=4 Tax=Musa troglodytarum TaxID=320322 RepID=A0A9E7HJQ5_9LILI|nr:endonuclease exonuclease phosphatase family domain containing protein [Musa troglodytarum]
MGIDLEKTYVARRTFLETSSVSFSGDLRSISLHACKLTTERAVLNLIPASSSERHSSSRIESLNLCSLESLRRKAFRHVQEFRIFVATWNVGGKPPGDDLDLESFLQVEGSHDIYVVGFQEIVPLNAGNVLVIEDNEPAAKWLALISQAINKPGKYSPEDSDSSNDGKHGKDSKSTSGLLFFQRPSLKVLSRNYRMDGALVKTCNCTSEPSCIRRRTRQLREFMTRDESSSSDEDSATPQFACSEAKSNMNYCLVASKQMVGIFLSVWVRRELVQHVGHLRVATIGRGIMGCLGNKGCIAMSMSLHRTSFCFVCSHLASGEKEGDELKRNSDVAEILKSAQFPRICKSPCRRIPERILDHDRVIWFGDLNYRVALSYQETRSLLRNNDWNSLLERDQLKIEREAGRVFNGWKEGKITFAPTYKYSQNSDIYAGETVKSKKKRRTPAWCDRILWHGNGMEQLQYLRGESKFSDHRPVCAVFAAQAEMNNRYRKACLGADSRIPSDELIPQRHSFY